MADLGCEPVGEDFVRKPGTAQVSGSELFLSEVKRQRQQRRQQQFEPVPDKNCQISSGAPRHEASLVPAFRDGASGNPFTEDFVGSFDDMGV